jgi:hypothetical protein
MNKGCFKKGNQIGKATQFKKGHISWLKGRKSPYSMEKSFNWKGGRRIKKTGHIEIRKPEHPTSHKDGYILEHRYIMEKFLGRNLKRSEIVHHKNGNRSDNRIENLEIITSIGKHRSIHTLIHNATWSRFGFTECIICHLSKYPHYAKGKCIKCYERRYNKR